MTDSPQKGVAAIVRAASAGVRSDAETIGIPDPLPGDARDGVKPGEWGFVPDMPPDCPVRVLGKGEGTLIYVVDTNGLLESTDASGFGRGFVEAIFGKRINYALWAWPRLNKEGKVVNFRSELVHQSFRGEADRITQERGLWDPTRRIRGRGAWRDKDNSIIYHAGSYVWRKGELTRAGVEIGEEFYPLRPKLPLPWHSPVEGDDNPAVEIGRMLRTWSWGRPEADPFLMLGYLAAGMMSGALEWRPSIFVVGDKAVGKSTLQNLMKLLLGESVLKADDATEAGIYQLLGRDALPVQIDEFESSDDNRKVMPILNMLRIGASGGTRARGGQDHKGVEFKAQSCFFLSAINPPPGDAASWSRLCVLSLRRLDPEKLKDAPRLNERTMGEWGRKLLRRLMDHWHEFEQLFEQYSQVLAASGGHSKRGCDTYGTFLAAAHVLLGDEGVDALGLPIDSFDRWGEWLKVSSLPEMDDQEENWRECISWLLQYQVDAWRGGKHLQIGGVLQEVRSGIDADIRFEKARDLLALAGLGLKASLPKSNPNWQSRGLWLAIPKRGNAVAKIFNGSKWGGGQGGAGVWTSALRQGPPGVIIDNAKQNQMRINNDVHRCTMVDLDQFDAWIDARADVPASTPAREAAEKDHGDDLTGEFR